MKKKYFLIFCLILFLSSVSFSQNQNYVSPKPDVSRLKFPDFKLYDIYSVQNNGKRYLKVKLGNLGFDYSGTIIFRIEYLGPGLSGKLTVSKNLTIKKNKRISVKLIQMANQLDCKGETVRITVDPFNKIVELNENNNTLELKVYRNNVSNGRIDAVWIRNTRKLISYRSRQKIFKVHPFDISHRNYDKVTIPFEVSVWNCGRKIIDGGRIKAYYYYESDCGNTNGFVYLSKSTTFTVYPGCENSTSLFLTLPLWLKKPNTNKYCFKIKKLLVKLYYETGEPRKLQRDNNFVFEVRYIKDPKYYTK